MAYTLADYQAAALHAAGRSSVDAGNSTLIMVNNALSELCNAHPWTWRHKSTTLSLVADQSYVSLPGDFAELRYLRGGASQALAVIPTSLDQIFQMRQRPPAVVGINTIHYAIGMAAQASSTALPTYRLEIFPTPAEAAADAMQVQYVRTVPDLAGATDRPDIPSHLHPILMTLVRGHAEFYELNQPGANWQIAHEMIERAKERDGMTQPVVGRIRGTVEQMQSGFPNNPYATDATVTIN